MLLSIRLDISTFMVDDFIFLMPVQYCRQGFAALKIWIIWPVSVHHGSCSPEYIFDESCCCHGSLVLEEGILVVCLCSFY